MNTNDSVQVDERGYWFLDLLMKHAPDPGRNGKDITPEAMIKSASWKAFEISAGLGLIPGPIGMAVILPEIITITKIQVNLVYQIAEYYGKRDSINHTIVLLVFGNAMGIYAGKEMIEKIGTRLVVRTLSGQAAKKLSQKLGVKISVMAVQKSVGRFVPFVAAPVFGALSKSMTKKIGQEAMKLFSQEINITADGRG